MRVLVVTNEKSVGAVLTRVTAKNAGAESLTRAEAALRAANPGVDFQQLKAGDVLIVPDAPDVAGEGGESVTGAVFTAAMDEARRGLAQLKHRLDTGEAEAAAEREALGRLLKARGLTALMSQDPSVKNDIGAVRASLTQDDKAATERKKTVARVLEDVTADLAEMRRRFE